MPRTVHVGADVDHLPSLSTALADPDVDEVLLHPGEYVEQVVVPPRRRPLLIRSTTGDAADVVLSFDLRQGDRGPTGMPYVQDCATLTIDADDVTLQAITVRNTFDRAAHPDLPDSQALALRTRGTRILIERCHLLGQQDTVLLDTPSGGTVRHVHLRDCLVAGNVDFLYGAATALIEGGEVRSVGPGYVAAPSTVAENPRGLCFRGVTFTADDGVAPGSVHLARPWHPGGRPHAVGQTLFVDCSIGAHVAADRWTDMSGFSWRDDARFGESGSHLRPGAVPPSADHALPVTLDPAAHLAGWDGPPGTTGRLHVLSDSTASEYGPDRAPRAGWGMFLSRTTGREVLNHAVSGMSTTSLLDSGTLSAALEQVRPGDVVLIGFGHNDSKDDERHADPYRSYPVNLRRALSGVRARRATPVLLTPVARRRFDGDRAVDSHGPYPQAVRRLAADDGVALVDLTRASLALWQSQGVEGSKESFLWLEPGEWPGYPDGERDDTHFSAEGARAVVCLVVDGLRELGLLEPSEASTADRPQAAVSG